MRRTFADLVYLEMKRGGTDIYVVTADMGYKMWDLVKYEFPKQFINVGVSEFLMVGVAIGLALEKKIPIAYSITPFLLYRPAELIRTYIQHEDIPVKLVGSGRGHDYSHDGISHCAHDDEQFMDMFNNISLYRPETKRSLKSMFREFLYNNEPAYLNLKR